MGIKPAAAAKLFEFTSLISELSPKVENTNAYDIAMEVFLRSGYMEYLRSDTTVEGLARVDNAEELLNSIKAFVEDGYTGTQIVYPKDEESPLALLPNYLENISLMSAIDENNGEEDSNKISLMTVHSAKGLEFSYVFVIGMEENLFPSVNMAANESELEDERRLFYVAITRAKIYVTLSYAQSRFRCGSHVNYPPSRFLKEINPKFLSWPALESEGLQKGGSWDRISNTRDSINSIRGNGDDSKSSSRPTFTSIPQKAPDPNFRADSISKLKAGQRVEHDRFGYGLLVTLEGDPLNAKAVVDFDSSGKKMLLLKFAKLRVVEE